MSASMSIQALTASFASPTSSQTFSASLPALPSDPKAHSVQGKTAYLSALRAGATQMQAEINTALTQRMEHDKVVEAAGKSKAQEEKAEEMYGEEDPEEDG
ncbi:hypothetical protein B0A55_00666 [Friedmanniomyces simplex]|uniref:EKC/KEOPS complex subunit GON7 n=1 Tax=Friedmanniomyces simplex TaxID=329884 RepID=A0A4V5NK96_9PEZI|nr:hypothetical protein B0A55_00666 [Friedmanniomyces simplex]